MRAGIVAVAASALVCATTVALVSQPAQPKPAAYLGSESCRSCHEKQYDEWKSSLHIRMTKPVAEATVVGNFTSEAAFEKYGRSYRFETNESRIPTPESRYAIAISRDGGPYQKFSVDYTLGFKRFQGYISKLPDGRMYVLPAFWHRESERWIDWKEITPVPDGNHDIRQIWNVTCFNCHATNLVKNFDVASKTYNTSWTEMGIGCEACHGPGEPHVTLMREWEKAPASRPSYDNSPRNRDIGKILKTFSPRSADPRAVYETCTYCHGNKRNYLTGFVPGERVTNYAEPFLMSEPIPDNDPQGEFWPDGKPSRFNRPQALMSSGCFKGGRITCTTCHLAHGSPNEHSLKVPVREPVAFGQPERLSTQGDSLCAQCHKMGDTHTRHAPASQGSRCIGCHMSDVNWRLLIRRRDHTFQPPVPELTAKYGEPNACTTCHDDKSPEWAARLMDQWYGDGSRRRQAVFVADTFYAAGTGDRASLPGLARLAVDRKQSAFIRASAVEFLGRLVSGRESSTPASTQTSFEGARAAEVATSPPATRIPQPETRNSQPDPRGAYVNTLIGAASDPEAIVRIPAVQALGSLGDPKAIAPLVARTRDESRVVRASAAAALFTLGVVRLDGAAGASLARAQEDYVATLSTFADQAADHALLGAFESARGRGDRALAEIDAAIHLDATRPQFFITKGIVLARAGRLKDAIAEWQTARKLDPSDQSAARLIAEAERQLGGKH